jgi:hypothetical protein
MTRSASPAFPRLCMSRIVVVKKEPDSIAAPPPTLSSRPLLCSSRFLFSSPHISLTQPPPPAHTCAAIVSCLPQHRHQPCLPPFLAPNRSKMVLGYGDGVGVVALLLQLWPNPMRRQCPHTTLDPTPPCLLHRWGKMQVMLQLAAGRCY